MRNLTSELRSSVVTKLGLVVAGAAFSVFLSHLPIGVVLEGLVLGIGGALIVSTVAKWSTGNWDSPETYAALYGFLVGTVVPGSLVLNLPLEAMYIVGIGCGLLYAGVMLWYAGFRYHSPWFSNGAAVVGALVGFLIFGGVV